MRPSQTQSAAHQRRGRADARHRPRSLQPIQAPHTARTRRERQAQRRPSATTRSHSRSRRGPRSAARYQATAQQRLKRFRRGSILAVALVALLLMLWQQNPADEQTGGEAPAADSTAQPIAADSAAQPAAATDLAQNPAEAVEQAAGTLQRLLLDFYGLMPKLVIALLLVVIAIVLSRFIRAILKRALRNWRRAEAASALVGIGIVLLAVGAAMSVIAGDATALVGSVGLVGLALSWALQAPIESFTGWLLNSFRVYYRVGDRISVGDVFGDVYRIDILSTTVWEAGGPDKPVQGAQPTGALATFPNSEILRATIVNYTRHFPYVWDEVTFGLANQSDLVYAKTVLERAAAAVLAPAKPDPSKDFQRLLRRRGLIHEINADPQVFFSNAESWTNATIRYLVPARERRKWASDLIVAMAAELARPAHAGRILDGNPRLEITRPQSPKSQHPSSD